MTRISGKFAQLASEERKAFIPFITAGDPNLATTEKLVLSLEKAGADLIELGIPFSDPMADGPVIQQASERALKNGVTLSDVLGLVGRLRKKTEIPLILMGYYNPIFIMGHERFADIAARAGVDGLLIVDLPPEEAEPLKDALAKKGIDLIFLLAPTSTADRIRKVSRMASGYIYYVSLTGVTGAALKLDGSIKAQVDKIKKESGLPVVVGFGISNPEQAKKVAGMGDGVVIGSALVSLIHEKVSDKLLPNVEEYIRSIKEAV